MELEIASKVKPPKTVYYDYVTKTYSIYIFDDIGYPFQYIKELRTLDKAVSNNTVKIFIGSNGGVLDTTIALIEHIKNCKGTTIAYVSFAASAATVLALACDKVYMYQNSYFMCHNFSTGGSGKGAELKARAAFDDAWAKLIFTNLYQGFMTETEIEEMRNDKDFWMLQSEVENRLRVVDKLLE
ncbi:MAG: Clp protease ClpP [Ignisphaera sp.]|nr:Clp protease ClpP [Ignisphaera sp.]